MKIKAIFLSALSFVLSGCLAAAEEGDLLLFHAGFDSYTAHADSAAGEKTCRGIEPDLQLRMHSGIAGKGNALCMSNRESCLYSAAGNFPSDQGTISLWVAPENWKPSDENACQVFFQAKLPGNVRVLIYKFKAGILRFGFFSPDREEYIEVPMKDDEWRTGRWHKLDAVWDKTEMRFYVDGRLAPRLDSYSKTRTNPCRLKEPFPLPQPDRDSFLALGIDKGFAHRENDITSFDELKICGRPLPEQEIRREYEKFYPPVRDDALPPVITAPKQADWTGASTIPLANPAGKFEGKIPPVSVSVRHDGENLCLLFRSGAAPKKMTATGRDEDSIWQMDDGFEFHCLGGNGRQYQFIINPRGAIWDSRLCQGEKDLGKAWNGKCQAKASADPEGWTAELVIPFSELGFERIPSELSGNFCFTMQSEPVLQLTWGKTGGQLAFSNPKNFGKIIPAEDKTSVSCEKLGNLTDGNLDLKLSAADSAGMNTEALLRRSDGETLRFPGNLLESAWTVRIPPGSWDVSWTVSRNRRILSRNRIHFQVNRPLETALRPLPSRQIIELETNLSAAGAEVSKVLRAGGLRARTALVSPDGRELSVTEYPLTDFRTFSRLALPEKPESGSYTVKTVVSGGDIRLESETALNIPDLTPFRTRLGLDHQTVEPWHPVTSEGDHRYGVLGRRYRIEKGPFPHEIESGNEVLLKSPPLLLIDTGSGPKPFQWEPASEGTVYDDCREFSGTGSGADGAIKAEWQGELWFDGFWKTGFTLSPSGSPVEIRSLTLVWSVPEEFAHHVLDPLLRPWQGDTLELKADRPYYFGDFLVWTLGVVKGLAWMPISQANWVNTPGENQVHLKRENGEVKIRVDLISRPAVLDKPATYRMSFMATPGKPSDPAWRTINNGNLWGDTPHENVRQLQTNPGDVYDYTLYGETLQPVHPERYKAYIRKQLEKGIRIIPYSQPAATIEFDEYYSFFSAEWLQEPSAIGGGSDRDWKTGQVYSRSSTCPHTQSGDLAVWRAARMLHDYPEIGGLFYDISQVCQCGNREHGHGGTDAFGQSYTDSNMLSLREFFLRMRKLVRRNGKILFLHAHNRFIPAVHGLADVWYPGEEYSHALAKNPEHFYCEEVSPEVYQATLYPAARGCCVMMMTVLEALHWHHPADVSGRKNDEPNTLSFLTPSLLHDTTVTALYTHRPTVGRWWGVRTETNLAAADFHGYWFDNTIGSAPDVKVSWYSWEKPSPWKYLLIAGNLTLRERKAELDLSRLPLPPETCRFMDLWENRELSFDEVRALTVRPNNFRLIGIAEK